MSLLLLLVVVVERRRRRGRRKGRVVVLGAWRPRWRLVPAAVVVAVVVVAAEDLGEVHYDRGMWCVAAVGKEEKKKESRWFFWVVGGAGKPRGRSGRKERDVRLAGDWFVEGEPFPPPLAVKKQGKRGQAMPNGSELHCRSVGWQDGLERHRSSQRFLSHNRQNGRLLRAPPAWRLRVSTESSQSRSVHVRGCG